MYVLIHYKHLYSASSRGLLEYVCTFIVIDAHTTHTYIPYHQSYHVSLSQVNGQSLLGTTQQEAAQLLQSAGNAISLLVCDGFDVAQLKPETPAKTPSLQRGESETLLTPGLNNTFSTSSSSSTSSAHAASTVILLFQIRFYFFRIESLIVLYSFIHSFILNIYIAPLQENHSEALPTMYLYIYIALVALHTNQKRFQCERPREKRAVWV